MTNKHAAAHEGARTKLPMWLQCMVALVGVAMLAGPVATVLWYR